MASLWGDSWGSSWRDSWGQVTSGEVYYPNADVVFDVSIDGQLDLTTQTEGSISGSVTNGQIDGTIQNSADFAFVAVILGSIDLVGWVIPPTQADIVFDVSIDWQLDLTTQTEGSILGSVTSGQIYGIIQNSADLAFVAVLEAKAC